MVEPPVIDFITDVYKSPLLVPTENQGRFDMQGKSILGPALGLETEPAKLLDVVLRVDRPTVSETPLRGYHWAITWTTSERDGHHLCQRIHLATENCNRYHYTNWGQHFLVLTQEANSSSIPIPIGQLSKPDRAKLVSISLGIPPLQPVDGRTAECQDWIVELLFQAERAGLFSSEQVNKALNDARSVTSA
ncbi:hypothetical protein BT69DRAFT_785530 [Atractiella rhizophila]|nr:hypothetical protein BT69DRAFT_785530 [Atractiella rhizophila]